MCVPISRFLFQFHGELMNPKSLLKDENAVSITVGFILTFTITVLVVSGIILSFYSFSEKSQETAMEISFDILGSGFAARVTSMEIMVNLTKSCGGTINQLEYDLSIPASIAGDSYGINITREKILLDAENGAKAFIPFNSPYNINDKIYSNGQDYTLSYDNDNNSMKIEQ